MYRTFQAKEGSVNGSKTLDFTIRMHRIVIVNDSVSDELKFKFHENEDFGTLKPSETIELEIGAKQLFLSTTSLVEYRIWGIG